MWEWLRRLFSRFKRKEPEFDFAAIRIGNVYVLPPEPEDIAWFRKRRRKEITRRAFVVGGVAAGLGLVALPFLPWGSTKPDAKQLLDPAIAKADPQLIRQLCLLYYEHPNREVRLHVVAYMLQFRDGAVRTAIWKVIRDDPDAVVRERALKTVLMWVDPVDVPTIVELYRTTPAARATVDSMALMLGHVKLQQALQRN